MEIELKAKGDVEIELSKDINAAKSNKSTLPQVLAALIVCMTSAASGAVLVWTSPALPDLEKTGRFGGLTVSQKSWIASAVTLGAVFSGPATGFLMDKFGRKNTFTFMSLPMILGWILIGYSPTAFIMTLGRLLNGFSVGGFILIGNVYLAEISEQGIRGVLMCCSTIALGAGILATYILGTYLSWFVLTVVNICFGIVMLLCVRTIPESPPYLIHKGQKKKAGEQLMRLRGATEFQQIETELNQMQSSTLDGAKNSPENSSLWKNLTRPGTLKAIGISFALMIFQQLCGVNAVIFYTSAIFSAAKTNLDANKCAIIIGVDIMFGIVLTSFLIDKLGRRMLLFISLLGTAVCLASLGTFFYLQRQNDGNTPDGMGWIPLVSLMLFMILYNIGIGPLAWFLMSEIIPTNVKGPASAAATSFNWILAFLVTKNFETFSTLFGIEICFWGFAVVCVIGFIFCILYVPETKGMTLEEIQRKYFSSDG